jgi:hypothetical protein
MAGITQSFLKLLKEASNPCCQETTIDTEDSPGVFLLGNGSENDPLIVNLDNRVVNPYVAASLVSVWNAQVTPLNRIWTNIAWSPELKRLVVTSHSTATDNIMTSDDGGKSWTVRNVPNTNNLRGVAWSPKLEIFATVASTGTGNQVNTSPDGETWTAQVTPGSHFFRDMIWVDELELFIAVSNEVASTQKVMTSSDGINWIMQTCPDRAWSDIVWSKELGLLCVSATGGIAGEKIMTSSDAINWTLHETPGDAGSWEGITWSGDLGLFVAVNFNTSVLLGQSVMTSPDGINWTLQNAPSNRWLSVAWSPQLGMFAAVAVNTFGPATVMTSPDAVNWTLQTPDTDRAWRRILWVKELGYFVAVAFYDGFQPPNNLIMINKPIDQYQQYLNLHGRSGTQRVAGKVNFERINLTSISTPSSLEDGDIWREGNDLKVRLGGVTQTITVT